MSKEFVQSTAYREVIHSEIRQIRVYPTREEASIDAAQEIIKLVSEKPDAAITYATGNTMIPLYQALAKAVVDGKADFSKTSAFHLDEYFPCGSDPEKYPYGFVAYLRKLVFKPLKIGKVYELNGLAPDPDAEADRYDRLLGVQPIDLAIVGIGPWSDETKSGCHIAFNESGTPFNSRTHVAQLSPVTVARDRVDRGQDSPYKALSQGIANILGAERIMFLAFGEEKSVSFYQAFYAEIGTQRPASALRFVGSKVTVFIDEDVASQF
jgi:glucosamine-6-phosphate deaminase